jgi:hypothetical protein
LGVKVGDGATVRLLAIERVPDAIREGLSAEDGLIFYFIVYRNYPGDANFHMKEPKDFTLRDESYADITYREMARAFEPQTTVLEIDEFFSKVRPDLEPRRRGEERREGLAVYAVILGAKLTSDVCAHVTVNFGWGDAIEQFDFGFRIPPESVENLKISRRPSDGDRNSDSEKGVSSLLV